MFLLEFFVPFASQSHKQSPGEKKLFRIISQNSQENTGDGYLFWYSCKPETLFRKLRRMCFTLRNCTYRLAIL